MILVITLDRCSGQILYYVRRAMATEQDGTAGRVADAAFNRFSDGRDRTAMKAAAAAATTSYSSRTSLAAQALPQPIHTRDGKRTEPEQNRTQQWRFFDF